MLHWPRYRTRTHTRDARAATYRRGRRAKNRLGRPLSKTLCYCSATQSSDPEVVPVFRQKGLDRYDETNVTLPVLLLIDSTGREDHVF